MNLHTNNKQTCENIVIKPLKRQKTIIRIENENIVKCKNAIFEMKTNCKTYNKLSICNNRNPLNITNTNCIPKLLSSENHKCTIINNQHVPTFCCKQ